MKRRKRSAPHVKSSFHSGFVNLDARRLPGFQIISVLERWKELKLASGRLMNSKWELSQTARHFETWGKSLQKQNGASS
jgi:hypothetical protein